MPSSSLPTHRILLVGHLTRAALDRSFDELSKARGGRTGGFNLLVDALAMTDYDTDARSRFVEWNAAHKKQIHRVAIVTEKVLWHMVVAAMSVASGQKMRAFSTVDEALGWMESEGQAR